MRKFCLWMVLLAAISPAAQAQTDHRVSASSDGWTVMADESVGEVTISHDGLGTVLKSVRLNLPSEHGLQILKTWSAEKISENQLSVKTTEPPTTWVFRMSANQLEISSTLAEAVITAQAPAPPQRIVARLIDPQGAPVDWVGTGEVAVTYGGSYTRNPSFLPRRNPECLYLALGQVSSGNLHSLFDRGVDIALDFPEQTAMTRNRDNQDLLDVMMPVPGNALIHVMPDYYTRTLGLPFYAPFDDSYFHAASMSWSSWTSYYGDVTEKDILQNTDWIAEHLKPYGFQYVQLDDGYDRTGRDPHYWIEKWDQQKFPHGPKSLADYIKAKGLHAGLWFVPNSYAGAVQEHPDWYLRDKQGKIILDYDTPALDSTNPEVLNFLKKEFTTLDDWGFEYYKFDGEHALPKYIPGVDLSKLYDKSIDPIVAYRNRLKSIREVLGPKRFVECDVAGTPLNGIGFFNSYFNGHDIYNNWQGMHALLSSVNAHGFLNHIVVYTMPGEGMDVGPRMTVEEAEKKRPRIVMDTERQRENPLTGLGTTLAEARTVVSHVALTGVAYSLASVMPELPAERTKLLQMTLPTVPILPVDLFSRGTDMQWDRFKHTTLDSYIHNYPEILDLKVNAKSGIYDVVGLTNWRSWTATRDLSFSDKLGLDPNVRYVAFDFWNQKLYGVFQGSMKVAIAPHDTRVLQLHPLLNHPQLVGTSRHISGAYSILDLAWDDSKQSLRGASETVPGDTYSLWIYVPNGETVSDVRANAGGTKVPVTKELDGNSLRISFAGQQDTVNWEVIFHGKLI